MSKKRCEYHQIKPVRLVSCISCNKLVCVDDSYSISIEELKKNDSPLLGVPSQKRSVDQKRVRMCIPCHADYRKSQLMRISLIVPCVVGIFLALMVIVLGFPFLETTFRSAMAPMDNENVLLSYGLVFAVLITFFMIPTLAATMLLVYLYQKWKNVKKFQLEKELFLKSVNL